MNKYHNQITKIDGINFGSNREAARYRELQLLEKAGQISELKVHPRYLLQEGFIANGYKERKIEYIADFEYRDTSGILVLEEIKGGSATKTEAYRIKRKLLLKKYPDIDFREIVV